jgi:hypothetical protein
MNDVNYFLKNKTNFKKFLNENNKKINEVIKYQSFFWSVKFHNDNILLYKLLKETLKIVNKIFNTLLTKEYFDIMKKDYIDNIELELCLPKNIIEFYETFLCIFELEKFDLNNILINDTFRNILYQYDYNFCLKIYNDENLISKFKIDFDKYYNIHQKTFENYRIIP